MLCNFQADIDNSGSINYGEFLAATLHRNKVEREDDLFATFSYFDKDGSGYITHDELQKACEEFGIRDTHVEDIIAYRRGRIWIFLFIFIETKKLLFILIQYCENKLTWY